MKNKTSGERWVEFWFVAGGGIYGCFKRRRWTELRELAMKLPALAWDVQQKEIDRLDAALKEACNILRSISYADGYGMNAVEDRLKINKEIMDIIIKKFEYIDEEKR